MINFLKVMITPQYRGREIEMVVNLKVNHKTFQNVKIIQQDDLLSHFDLIFDVCKEEIKEYILKSEELNGPKTL